MLVRLRFLDFNNIAPNDGSVSLGDFRLVVRYKRLRSPWVRHIHSIPKRQSVFCVEYKKMIRNAILHYRLESNRMDES
jgi:hypothetical protein